MFRMNGLICSPSHKLFTQFWLEPKILLTSIILSKIFFSKGNYVLPCMYFLKLSKFQINVQYNTNDLLLKGKKVKHFNGSAQIISTPSLILNTIYFTFVSKLYEYCLRVMYFRSVLPKFRLNKTGCCDILKTDMLHLSQAFVNSQQNLMANKTSKSFQQHVEVYLLQTN